MTNLNRIDADQAAVPAKLSSPIFIVLAWALVVLPTAWGLTYTVENALKIFTAPSPSAASPPNPTAATPGK